MHNFRGLNIWVKSIEFATKFYQISNKYPKSELYSFTSQSRKACYSIPSNIAEDAGRNSNEQFSHFLNIAIGSSLELECKIKLPLI